MKQVKAILLGIFTLIPFSGISFFIYYFFPTTPALIVVLIILMAGAMLAFYVYSRKINEGTFNSNKADTQNFPPIERGLIFVSPAAFCDKLEKFKGNLFIASLDEVGKDITLLKGEYNRLTDETALFFTNGIQTIFRGIEAIAVGSDQFVIFHFNEMVLLKNKGKTAIQMSRKRLVVQEKNETTELKVTSTTPIYVFDWSE